MTRRRFASLCSLLLCAVLPALAQGRSAASDPISGTWTGELTPAGAGPVSVTLRLKFDGKEAVTGSFTGLPSPGDVKKGTFTPKNGALKLQLGKDGDDAVLLTLEGTVAKGTATGRFDGEMSGAFTLKKTAAGSKAPPAAAY
jgi:hypothetical protein